MTRINCQWNKLKCKVGSKYAFPFPQGSVTCTGAGLTNEAEPADLAAPSRDGLKRREGRSMEGRQTFTNADQSNAKGKSDLLLSYLLLLKL